MWSRFLAIGIFFLAMSTKWRIYLNTSLVDVLKSHNKIIISKLRMCSILLSWFIWSLFWWTVLTIESRIASRLNIIFFGVGAIRMLWMICQGTPGRDRYWLSGTIWNFWTRASYVTFHLEKKTNKTITVH